MTRIDNWHTRCTRCGQRLCFHGDRAQDSPPGCGWTYDMAMTAAAIKGTGSGDE